MHRRRSALSLSAAALVLAGVPLLAGCGDQGHPGAAAVVDGERIEIASVQARAEAVREAQEATPNGAELVQRTGTLSRFMLNEMLRQRLIEETARAEGVRVTRGEVQRFREEQEKLVGGPKALAGMLLQQQSVAPDQVEDVLRTDLLVRKIADSLGVDLAGPDANARMTEVFAKAAKGMGIDVNPRFGEWRDEALSLTGRTEPWIKAAEEPQQPA